MHRLLLGLVLVSLLTSTVSGQVVAPEERSVEIQSRADLGLPAGDDDPLSKIHLFVNPQLRNPDVVRARLSRSDLAASGTVLHQAQIDMLAQRNDLDVSEYYAGLRVKTREALEILCRTPQIAESSSFERLAAGQGESFPVLCIDAHSHLAETNVLETLVVARVYICEIEGDVQNPLIGSCTLILEDRGRGRWPVNGSSDLGEALRGSVKEALKGKIALTLFRSRGSILKAPEQGWKRKSLDPFPPTEKKEG